VLKQKAIAGIPIQVYKVATDGTTKLIDDPNDPYVKLLKDPNPHESWPKFIDHVVGDLEHAGNAFIERVGPEKYEKTRPRELNALPPEDMEIQRGNARQPVMGYKWGGDTDFQPWQICHIKHYNPNDYFWGLSPLTASAQAIDQNNAAASWNYSLFKNSGRPSGILTLQDEVVDETSFDEIIKKLRRQYTGEDNAGQVMVLTGDMRWTQTSFNPTEMDFGRLIIQNTRKIASCFGVPPQLIGEETSKTYSNYSEARQAFYKETILPLMDLLLAELDGWLSPLFGTSYKLKYDKTAIEAIQEDTNARYDRVLRAVTNGVLTPLEGRRVLGYKEIAGDKTEDKRLIPMNLWPEGVPRPQSASGGFGGGAQIEQQQPTDEPLDDGNGQQPPKMKRPQAGRPTNAEVPPKVDAKPRKRGSITA
jgi:HK97 family phage portal protein